MNAMQRLFTLFILSFLLAACAALVQLPQVAIIRTDIVALDSAGFDVELYLGVKNPNPFDITLQGYTYDLQVMTLPLATGGLQQTAVFPAGQETALRIPVRIRYQDLWAILKRRPDPDKIPYRVDARLHLGTPLGDLLIPVDSSSTFSLPERYRPDTYLDRLKDLWRGKQ